MRAIAVIGFAACVSPGELLAADQPFNLRVAYVGGPAADALQAGRTEDAIALLEERVAAEGGLEPDELGSLCAAYILDRQFNVAEGVCDDAVLIDGTALAYNNRGVLRAHIGDIDGSKADFARIRVLQEEFAQYLRDLRENNARMMATDNLEVIDRLRPEGSYQGNRRSSRARGAEVEDPGPGR